MHEETKIGSASKNAHAHKARTRKSDLAHGRARVPTASAWMEKLSIDVHAHMARMRQYSYMAHLKAKCWGAISELPRPKSNLFLSVFHAELKSKKKGSN